MSDGEYSASDSCSSSVSEESYFRPRSYLVDEVDALQIRLGLSDLRTRRGLKRAFLQYEDTIATVHNYTANQTDNEHDMMLIGLLWCRACEDPLFALKLQKDSGIMSLVRSRIHPHRRALTQIAWLYVCERITRKLDAKTAPRYRNITRDLIQTTRNAKGDNLVSELAMSALSNILRAAPAEKADIDPTLRILHEATIFTVRDVHPLTFNRMVAVLAGWLSPRCKWIGGYSYESCMLYNIGVARRGTARQRRLALRTLTHLCDPTRVYDWDQQHLARALQRMDFSSEMRTAMRRYGVERCESTRVARNMAAVGDAVSTAFRNSDVADMVGLGLRLCELIRADPLCVCFDDNFARRAKLGTSSPQKLGAAFDDWAQLLTQCAVAVRQMPEGNLTLPVSRLQLPRDDVADILDVHHHLLRNDCFCTDLSSISYNAFKRNHSELFFLLPLLKSPDIEEALRCLTLADHFIKRTSLSPFQLIFVGCLAGALFEAVLRVSHDDSKSPRTWEAIVTATNGALTYANLYIAHCAPDSVYHDRMLSVKALATQLIYGPGAKLLLDSKGFLRPVRLANEFYKLLYRKNGYNEMHDTLLYFVEHSAFVGRVMDPTLTKLYPHVTPEAAQEEFVRGDFMRSHRPFSFRDQREWEDRIDASRAVDWLNAPRTVVSETLVSWHAEDLDLHACAHCELESAVLRRCSLCREVRYCGRECQAEDWQNQHREECSRAFV
ncbi:hypothetical protein AURDEDRAFT_163797 [Auricularia subglabra TFB-10046 SS5]|nr:hypothetical protein AURDEDRAFT_163797 [Auricularia subglabra TFB-10046 SS5]